ncbi:MAG: sensory rhodopsin transducer [Methylomonas sp.]
MNIGHKRWVIADGYIPAESTGTSRELVSHDAVCILNCGLQDAHVEFTLYFANRDAVGPYQFVVKAQRTRHLRFNEFTDPEPVPHNTDYASVISSDVPIIVQHTRLDSRQPALALMSTIAYPVPDGNAAS